MVLRAVKVGADTYKVYWLRDDGRWIYLGSRSSDMLRVMASKHTFVK